MTATPDVVALRQRLDPQDPVLAPETLPEDLDGALKAFDLKQETLLANMPPDGDMAAISEGLIPEYLRIAGPFQQRLAELQAELDRGVITPLGYRERAALIRDGLTKALAEGARDPVARRLGAVQGRYETFKPEAPTAEERSDATNLAIELPLLTPHHGLARVARVLLDAVKTGKFGTAIALRPFLASLYERAGTDYSRSEPLHRLLKKFDALRDWKTRLGEARRPQVANMQQELEAIHRIMVETGGRPEKSRLWNTVRGRRPGENEDTPVLNAFKRPKQEVATVGHVKKP